MATNSAVADDESAPTIFTPAARFFVTIVSPADVSNDALPATFAILNFVIELLEFKNVAPWLALLDRLTVLKPVTAPPDKTTFTESAFPTAVYDVVAGGDAPPPTAPPSEVVPPPPHAIKRHNIPDEITALERIVEFSNVSTP
jgi:hypothetical protein